MVNYISWIFAKTCQIFGLHLCSLLLSLALTQQQAIDSGTVAAVAAARIYTNLTIAKDSVLPDTPKDVSWSNHSDSTAMTFVSTQYEFHSMAYFLSNVLKCFLPSYVLLSVVLCRMEADKYRDIIRSVIRTSRVFLSIQDFSSQVCVLGCMCLANFLKYVCPLRFCITH